jgi:hypothetical protein
MLIDSMTTRSRRKLEDERLARLLATVRSGEMLDPDDETQDRIEALVGQWKNAEIIGRTPEAEATRGELYTLLEKIEAIYRGPDRALEEELVWAGLDDYLEGRIPNYPGDHVRRQKIDARGRYIEEVEIPGVGTRTKVIMSAATTAELQRLQGALRTAELTERTARAAGKPAAQAMAKREAAEDALDTFLQAHNVSLPMSRPQQEVDLVEDEEGEGNG